MFYNKLYYQKKKENFNKNVNFVFIKLWEVHKDAKFGKLQEYSCKFLEFP